MRASLWSYSVIVLCLCFLGGCQENLPKGTVATINGKPIALYTLQALCETEFASFGQWEDTSVESLRKRYGRVLATLIVYELMIEELEAKKIFIAEEAVKKYEQDVREDYADSAETENDFDAYLREHTIDINAWRAVVRYHLAVQCFKDKILRPSFSFSLDSVTEYYTTHRESFTLPEAVKLYAVSLSDTTVLDTISTMDDLEQLYPHIDGQRMTLDIQLLPKEVQKLLPTLGKRECAVLHAKDVPYTFFCVLARRPQQVLTISEAYAYVEDLLASERMEEALFAWLEKKLQNVRIEVSQHLIQDMRS